MVMLKVSPRAIRTGLEIRWRSEMPTLRPRATQMDLKIHWQLQMPMDYLMDSGLMTETLKEIRSAKKTKMPIPKQRANPTDLAMRSRSGLPTRCCRRKGTTIQTPTDFPTETPMRNCSDCRTCLYRSHPFLTNPTKTAKPMG